MKIGRLISGKVLFTDESKFQLLGSKRRQFVRSEKVSKYIGGFRARQHLRSLAPVMNDE